MCATCLFSAGGGTQECAHLVSILSSELQQFWCNIPEATDYFPCPPQISGTFKEVRAQSHPLDCASGIELHNSVSFLCQRPCLEESCFFSWGIASPVPVLTHLPPSRYRLMHVFMFAARCWCFPWCQSLLPLTPALSISLLYNGSPKPSHAIKGTKRFSPNLTSQTKLPSRAILQTRRANCRGQAVINGVTAASDEHWQPGYGKQGNQLTRGHTGMVKSREHWKARKNSRVASLGREAETGSRYLLGLRSAVTMSQWEPRGNLPFPEAPNRVFKNCYLWVRYIAQGVKWGQKRTWAWISSIRIKSKCGNINL